MMAPNIEEINAHFVLQRQHEAVIATLLTSLAKSAEPFGDWNKIYRDHCTRVVTALVALRKASSGFLTLVNGDMTPLPVRVTAFALVCTWISLVEKIRNVEIPAVAFREICESFKEDALHDRSRLSKKLDELDTEVSKAIKENEVWRKDQFKKLFGQEMPDRYLAVVITEITSDL